MLSKTNRDYLFDNLKLLLIFLVVFGHTMEQYIISNVIIRSVYEFIYIFHMPLFVFVSGYFSKNIEKSKKNAITNLLVPFIIVNIAAYIFTSILNGERTFGVLSIISPSWTLWYLISLFIWRISLKRLINIKYILPISIILGLMVGLVPKYTGYLSLGRTIAFLPFFLAGYYTNKDSINKIKKSSKLISSLIILISLCVAIYVAKNNIVDYKFLYLSNSYSSSGLNMLQGILLRLALYILATLTSASIINLIPNKKFSLTKLGENTMVIYIGHSFILLTLNKFVPQFNYLILIVPILIVFILSRPKLNNIYNNCMNFINYRILRTQNTFLDKKPLNNREIGCSQIKKYKAIKKD